MLIDLSLEVPVKQQRTFFLILVFARKSSGITIKTQELWIDLFSLILLGEPRWFPVFPAAYLHEAIIVSGLRCFLQLALRSDRLR